MKPPYSPSSSSVLLFATFCFLLLCSVAAAARGPQAFVHEQRLDHFNFQERRSFGQRYFVDDQYTTNAANAPILFYAGAEQVTDISILTYSVLPYYAKPLGALIVAAEHRYYGQSTPFGPNPTSEQLGWLSVEQALADYAAIVKHVMEAYNTTGPAYSIGGSYGGMLSALLRTKYGNVFWGSIASAAPVLAASTNPETWFELVSLSYQRHDQLCAANIEKAFSYLQSVSSTQSGRALISKAFGLCNELADEEAAKEALWWAQWGFSFIAEFNMPYPLLYTISPPLDHACSLMTHPGRDVVTQLGEAVRFSFNLTYNPVSCFNSTSLWDTGAAAVLQVHEWLYQVCTVVVIPVSSDGISDIFTSYSWDYYLPRFKALCESKYNVTPDFAHLPTYLIDSDLRSYSNIIFTNGDYDPVRGYTPLQNVSSSVISLLATGGHTQDVLMPREGLDHPSLVELRRAVLNELGVWTREFFSVSRK